MKNSSRLTPGMQLAAAALLATSCNKAPEVVYPTTSSPVYDQIKLEALRQTSAELGWFRTLEQAAKQKAVEEEAKKHPWQVKDVDQQRARFQALIAGTGYDQCDPDKKSETDKCRAKALLEKHCPSDVNQVIRDLTGEIGDLIFWADSGQCLLSDRDRRVSEKNLNTPQEEIQFDQQEGETWDEWGQRIVNQALARHEKRKLHQKKRLFPSEIDIEPTVHLGLEDVQGWTPACLKPPKMSVQGPDKVGDAPGFSPRDYEKVTTTDPLEFQLNELKKSIITFATTEALGSTQKGKGPKFVEKCLDKAAEKLSPPARKIFDQARINAMVHHHYLFWLDANFIKQIGPEEGRKFADEYMRWLQ